MLRLNLEKVRKNVQQASTEDLLDRLTIYHDEMEPEALDLIDAELRARGVTVEQIEEYAERRGQGILWESPGRARRCSFCREPARGEGWRWHRLWGWVPLFPRFVAYCAEHQPRARRTTTSG